MGPKTGIHWILPHRANTSGSTSWGRLLRTHCCFRLFPISILLLFPQPICIQVTFHSFTSSYLHAQHATYTGANQHHSLHIPLVKWKVHSYSFFQRTATFCNRLAKKSFPDHYNLNLLTSSSSGLTVICHIYPHKQHFLAPPLMFILHRQSLTFQHDSLLSFE